MNFAGSLASDVSANLDTSKVLSWSEWFFEMGDELALVPAFQIGLRNAGADLFV